MITNATPTDPSGTATGSQRGCFSLRSIRTLIARASAGHQQAELLDGRGGGVHLARDLPLVEDDDAVGQREHLVEVLADQQHRDVELRRIAKVV